MAVHRTLFIMYSVTPEVFRLRGGEWDWETYSNIHNMRVHLEEMFCQTKSMTETIDDFPKSKTRAGPLKHSEFFDRIMTGEIGSNQQIYSE